MASLMKTVQVGFAVVGVTFTIPVVWLGAKMVSTRYTGTKVSPGVYKKGDWTFESNESGSLNLTRKTSTVTVDED